MQLKHFESCISELAAEVILGTRKGKDMMLNPPTTSDIGLPV